LLARVRAIQAGTSPVEQFPQCSYIYGRVQDEHDCRLYTVLQTMQSAGMTLNKAKCQFSQWKILFLGQLIDETGIKPDPAKILAVQTMPIPKNVSDLCRFLGMVNHLSKFAPHLADKTKPLQDLLIKDNHWVWERIQQQTFLVAVMYVLKLKLKHS